jgi:hypothetical protein
MSPGAKRLDGACRKQPCGAVGRGEQRQAGRTAHQPGRDHRAAAEPVRQLTEQEQRRHQHRGVDREDQGQFDGREAVALAVHRVQRRGHVRAHQHHEQRHRNEQERPPRSTPRAWQPGSAQ